ncbi:hypothetical protein E2P84_38895 [Burkholderia cepacia]|uniref:ATP synthase subunit I n=1 Tax=Burkholderia cepacia TaxID=292 RepID=A0AAX2RF80_BURCE|nr:MULTISPECIES: hypothetical protein [Burkholderia cepacia complex]TES63834.1 hypothetical protein E2P84_38895 [Burkholderia cepacia]TES96716.1 hypothetical protein E3D36_34695 [Burkholderia cepacia]TEU34404.1 hypothetical protein E3D37_38975 [Burkholderia cepacia]TEU38514.1 hypothetical protein E3D38_37545 [Burkholderia cepacia]TEU87151.1 hypothetical protein E3D40_39325 [Burkholderia cepacia]
MKPKMLAPLSFVVCMIGAIASVKLPHGLARAAVVAVGGAAGFSFVWHLCRLIENHDGQPTREDLNDHKRMASVTFSATMMSMYTVLSMPIDAVSMLNVGVLALTGFASIARLAMFVEGRRPPAATADTPAGSARI